MARPEDALQRAVLQCLELLRLQALWYHVPCGGRRTKTEAAILKGLGAVAGTPDLVLHWRGGSGFLELKAPKGRLSAAQRSFRDRCRELGIQWAEIRDVLEVPAVIDAWGVPRR